MNTLKTLIDNNMIDFGENEFAKNSVLSGVFGSTMYGTAVEGRSDIDIMSIVVPPLEQMYPHTMKNGYVLGFTAPPKQFKCIQEHNLVINNIEHDVNIFSVVKFINDCLGANNNNIAFLYAPNEFYYDKTEIGDVILSIRDEFMNQSVARKFNSFAYSEYYKVQNQICLETDDRHPNYNPNGFAIGSVKSAYTALRLVEYSTQVLCYGTLDPRSINKDLLRLRSGFMSLQEWREQYAFYDTEFKKALNKNPATPEYANISVLQKALTDIIEIAHGVGP